MKKLLPKRLFNQILALFFVLGVAPTLLITIIFALPIHLDFSLYRKIVGLLLILSTVSTLCLAALVTRMLKWPLDQLLKAQKFIGEGRLDHRLESKSSHEIYQLFHGFNQMATRLEEAKKKEERMAQEAAFAKVASQVAHDLRSPLSSLEATLEYFKELKVPDEKFSTYSNLLELSVNRLRGIAEDVLKKYTKAETPKTVFSLHKILDELVGEYESQDTFKKVQFTKKYTKEAIALYGDSRKLQRAFGNIIKNAIEAMNYQGHVLVETAVQNSSAQIKLSDTGPGMSEEKVKKVLAGGFTEGKHDGHGIGMTVVQETIRELSGRLSIESVVGHGTSFIIDLPLPTSSRIKGMPREEHAMERFVVHAYEHEPIAVIDDDASLREQWRIILAAKGIKVMPFSSYENLMEHSSTFGNMHAAIVDYHFENSEKNGADIIHELQKRGFSNLHLCSAEYWKPSLRRIAEELKVPVCPKPLPKIDVEIMHAMKPITVSKKEGHSVLVIDDDELMHMTWKIAQNQLHIKELFVYHSLEELMRSKMSFEAIDIAFVDKNIEHSQFDGFDVAQYLKEHKIPRVVLATGENVDSFKNNPDPKLASIDYFIDSKIPESLEAFV